MTQRLPPELPDFAELERFGAEGLYKADARLTPLYREMERQRAERAHRLELHFALELARDMLAEIEARAAVERIVLPTDGDDEHALLLSLRGLGGDSPPLATEERPDGRTVEIHAGSALAFVPPEVWERHGGRIRESLRRAHRSRAGDPVGFVVVEPGGRRVDLLELIGDQPMLAMSRSALLENLALALPLCPTAQRWFRAALESRDPLGSTVARAIHGTFAKAGRLNELAQATAAE
jgi:hypothetical protein